MGGIARVSFGLDIKVSMIYAWKNEHLHATFLKWGMRALSRLRHACVREIKPFASELAEQERQPSRFLVQISRLEKISYEVLNVGEREISSALFLSWPIRTRTALMHTCSGTCFLVLVCERCILKLLCANVAFSSSRMQKS